MPLISLLMLVPLGLTWSDLQKTGRLNKRLKVVVLVAEVTCVNALCCQVCSSDMIFHTICGVRLPHAEDFGGKLCC